MSINYILFVLANLLIISYFIYIGQLFLTVEVSIIMNNSSENFSTYQQTKPDYSKIAFNLKRCRNICELSQKAIADALNTSISYVSKVETGKTTINLNVLLVYSSLCNIPIDMLINPNYNLPDSNIQKALDIEILYKLKNLSREDKEHLLQIIDSLNK